MNRQGADEIAFALRRSLDQMSPHLQFLLADVIAMLATAPIVVLARRRRLRHRTSITALYAMGFGLIALTLLIDTIWNPPLFFHGFVPGIGIGLLLGCAGLYAQDATPSGG